MDFHPSFFQRNRDCHKSVRTTTNNEVLGVFVKVCKSDDVRVAPLRKGFEVSLFTVKHDTESCFTEI